MNKNKIIRAANAPKPVGAYPHARQIGDLLFLSGIGPRDPETNEIPGLQLNDQGLIIHYDFEAQVHAVFQNIKLVLEASGSSWNKLIDITVFLTNMKEDFETFNRIYSDYFTDHQPCRTTVEVNALPTPIAIELKCIAEIS